MGNGSRFLVTFWFVSLLVQHKNLKSFYDGGSFGHTEMTLLPLPVKVFAVISTSSWTVLKEEPE